MSQNRNGSSRQSRGIEDRRGSSSRRSPSRSSYSQSSSARQQRPLGSSSPARAPRTSSTDLSARSYSRRAPQDYGRLRKKKSRKKTLLIIVAIVLALILGCGIAAFAYINSINAQLHSGIDDEDMAALQDTLVETSAGEPFYILLMGTDRRSDEGETQDRSDSMILARVDPQTKQTVLVSIHRDIPILYQGEYIKMNALHYYGGAAAAVAGVSQFAGVNISHYAEIDFDAFASLIDDLGGIEIDVSEYVDATDTDGTPLYNRDGSEASDIEPGLQTLDGDQALTFCRSRTDYNGDQQRAANQRIVLQAVANKVLNLPYNEMITYMNDIASCISTDLTVDEILSIAEELRGMTSDDIYSYMVPTEGFYDTDGSTYGIARCWWEKVYEDDWKSMMATIDAGGIPSDQTTYYEGNIADEYKNGSTSESTSSDSSSSSSS
jgi:polyisoprenyl-teichoic acid--peptidoglycan teichoic acid transferase